MKLLLTGANGFVGSHLLDALGARGHEVIGLVRRESRGFDPLRHHPWDGRGLSVDLLDGVEGVVHAAGAAHRPGAPEKVFFEGNRDLTRAIASAVRASEVRVLVHLSSIAADESAGGRADAPYGRSKREAEASVEQLGATGKLGINVRPPLIYGPGAPGNWAKLLRLARSPAPLPFATVRNRRSYLGIENLCSAVAAAVESCENSRAQGDAGPGPLSAKCGSYALADPEPLSLGEVLSILRGAIGRPPALFPFPSAALARGLRLLGKGAMADGLFGDLVLDSAPFRDAFDWSPACATAQGMADSILASS